MYFRWEAINVGQRAENDPSDGFNLESPKLAHTYIHTDILISHSGYNVTDNFRLAVIEVQKTCENAASDFLAAAYIANRLS